MIVLNLAAKYTLYFVNRNGTNLLAQLDPGDNSFIDDISSSTTFPIGTLITYKIKDVNEAGES